MLQPTLGSCSAATAWLFLATDQTPLGNTSLAAGVAPAQAVSDGINFFVLGSGNGPLWKF